MSDPDDPIDPEPGEGEQDENAEPQIERRPSISSFADSDPPDADDMDWILKMAEREREIEEEMIAKKKRKVLLKKSRSDAHLPRGNGIPQQIASEVTNAELQWQELARSQSTPILNYPLHESRKQVPSQFKSAPSFSFGKLYSGIGTFKIPPKDIRTAYLNENDTPGVGTYDMDKIPVKEKWAPKYTFCKSGTLRDSMIRRYTEWGHVLHHSNLNNPGPPEYNATGEKNSLQKTNPSYTFGYRRPKIKGHWTIPTPAPNAYYNEVIPESHSTLTTRPKWKIYDKRTDPHREKRPVIHLKVGTNDTVGPGAYRHPSSLVTREDVDYKHR